MKGQAGPTGSVAVGTGIPRRVEGDIDPPEMRKRIASLDAERRSIEALMDAEGPIEVLVSAEGPERRRRLHLERLRMGALPASVWLYEKMPRPGTRRTGQRTAKPLE
jgi:hypothetical protein